MRNHIRQSGLLALLGILLWLVLGFAPSLAKTQGTSTLPFLSPMGPSLTPTPFFRFPVVPNAEVSGYFDHHGTYPNDYSDHYVTFHNGRNSIPGNGFMFTCPSIGDAWIGCEVSASSEPACPDSNELWYDVHHGTDFEYAANWRTGSSCNLGQFSGVTRSVYAPAKGKVAFAGYDSTKPANGYHIILRHDMNGDGNYDNDDLRSFYLHFTSNGIAVVNGQIVNEGQFLGTGGMTGYAWTPHLHFEVQRLINGQWTPVDPFGWTGSGSDPWPYANYPLWRYYNYIPAVLKNYCSYGEKLVNGNFNTGDATGWVASRSNGPDPIVMPMGGGYAAMLGRYDNNHDQLYQTVCVPASVSDATLTYSWWVSSLEVGPLAYDVLYVRVYDANGNLLRELNMLSNLSQRDQWFVATSDLRDFAGQTIRISFEAVMDGSISTAFWIENVSFATLP